MTINGGIFNNAIIDGGYTETGNANYNIVNITSGKFNLTGTQIDGFPGIYGGYVAKSGNAIGNKVNIYGGTINGEILGGYTKSGEVSGNEINIFGGDISNAVIRAGDIGGSDAPFGSGNKLNFHTKDINAKNASGFDTINFYLPSNVQNGDNILRLTDGSTNWSDTQIGVYTRGTNLNQGDMINLVTNDNGLSLDLNKIRTYSPHDETGRNTASYGVAWDNYVHYDSDGKTLTAEIQERKGNGLKEQIDALTEGPNSVKGMIDSGTDRLLNWLPPEEIETRGINETTEYEMFMGLGGEILNIDTGHGSKLKNTSGGTNIGFARALSNRHGMFLFAPITDYGSATYDTSLRNGTRGGGNAQYFTAGLIARQWNNRGNNRGMYYEASFRAGRMKTGFTSDNFEENQKQIHVSYNAHTPVYTGHVRIGWRGDISKQNTLDVYGIYSHNHIGGIDAEISQVNQTYFLDSQDSKRVRLGARLIRTVSDHNRFYSGIAYQYNFDSSVIGNFMGETTNKTGIKGSSAMIELGWQLKPTPNSAVMLDSALVGWIGKQKGLSFQFKMKKEF